MTYFTHRRVATWHRRLGITLALPILVWIISAAAMRVALFNAPNGLQGAFALAPYNSVDLDLGQAKIAPAQLLKRLKEVEQLERVQWIRLEARGDRLLYTVKPKPFVEAMVFDAFTGERLDPLSNELLTVIANESLDGTQVARMSEGKQFHREYLKESIETAVLQMEGRQPSELVLARASGRTLERTDATAATFEWWYRYFHVFQWGEYENLFTGILYGVAAGVFLMAALGLRLLWLRRKRSYPSGRTRSYGFIRLHRFAAVTVGFYFLLQMPVGAYMWLSLGPLEAPFRGQDSINSEWEGGLPIDSPLVAPAAVVAGVAEHMPPSSHPIQFIEWRNLLGDPCWIVGERKDQEGEVYRAADGRKIDVLAPEAAGEIARRQMKGNPDFEFVMETRVYSNDLNRGVPAYLFRFHDDSETDVFVAQQTGAVMVRRPMFWRAFLPFFAYHTFEYTENLWIDTAMLALFLAGTTMLVASGLGIAYRRARRFRL